MKVLTSDLEMILTSELLTSDIHELEAYTGKRESKVMFLQKKNELFMWPWPSDITVLWLQLNVRLGYFLLYVF